MPDGYRCLVHVHYQGKTPCPYCHPAHKCNCGRSFTTPQGLGLHRGHCKDKAAKPITNADAKAELLSIHKIIMCPAEVKKGEYDNHSYTVKAVANYMLCINEITNRCINELKDIKTELEERDIHLLSKHCWCNPVTTNNEKESTNELDTCKTEGEKHMECLDYSGIRGRAENIA